LALKDWVRILLRERKEKIEKKLKRDTGVTGVQEGVLRLESITNCPNSTKGVSVKLMVLIGCGVKVLQRQKPWMK